MEIKNCSCGHLHYCPIDHIIIKGGALKALPYLLTSYHHILGVFDTHTYALLKKYDFFYLEDYVILTSSTPVVIPDQAHIDIISSHITSHTDLVIGFGSGVINDLCKITSFNHDLPYYICATAPSMDGFASSGSALLLDGMKITLNASPPKAIIGDIDILKDAPLPMIQAGFGDIMGKYSCLNDWALAHLIHQEYLCPTLWAKTYEIVDALKPQAQALLNREPVAIGHLMQALVDVGVMMSYAGSSRPASGSEHHLSHFFEVKGLLDQAPYLPHGIDVLYSSVLTASIRSKIVSSSPRYIPFYEDLYHQDINRIYTRIAPDISALQAQAQRYTKAYRDEEYTFVLNHLDAINKLLKEAPSQEEMLAIVQSIGLNYQDFLDLYGIPKINDALKYAKDLKDRYSVLWLYNTYYNDHHLVSAHRGYAHLPHMVENTLSSFIEAGRHHAQMIETDARVSQDGVIIACHDAIVKGYDAQGQPQEYVVSQTSSQDLLRLCLAPLDPAGPQYVPTLKSILEICKSYQMRANIDLKEGALHALDVAHLVQECGMSGKVIYATNGAGIETIKAILALDPQAMFIDTPINFNYETLHTLPHYERICFAYTRDFSEANIASIKNNGCLLAAISINSNNYATALATQPAMLEYPHTSDFVHIEEDIHHILN